ncbi:MAG: hypothetical protein H6559_17665 [Lewinellaceae bacterium]|nr:hypothetical protein [Lewinellaceae bacterium]
MKPEEIHDTNTYCPLWPQISKCVFLISYESFSTGRKAAAAPAAPPSRRLPGNHINDKL